MNATADPAVPAPAPGPAPGPAGPDAGETTSATIPDAAEGRPGALRVMSMLHEHVPLALLCDLTAPEGPRSRQILEDEGRPESTWWEQ